MPITSHDVARLAGVSQPSVSRALRDRPGVSLVTRKRIRAAATALGYVASQTGRSLSTRTTRRVAIVAAELHNPFYPALIEPLHEVLEAAGYRTVLLTDGASRSVTVDQLADGSLDGVVLTTLRTQSRIPDELARRGIPFVMVNRELEEVAADACVVDNAGGAASVADLLVDLGHERVAAVLGPRGTSTSRQREDGLRDALAARGVALRPELVHRGEFDAKTGRSALLAFATMAHAPTAVFCANDVIALGLCNEAATRGVRIPEDLTVVGFDDISMAEWEVFGLTTVHADLGELARLAIASLVARIQNPGGAVVRHIVPTELVLRRTHTVPRSRLAIPAIIS